jgi:hypothetical protein
MKSKDKREWINTGIQFSMLCVMVVTAIYGLYQVTKISVTLEQLKLRNVVLEGNVTLVDEEGKEVYKIYKSDKGVVFEVNGSVVYQID